MNRHQRDFVAVLRVQLREIRQFRHARRTPCRPEVDDRHFPLLRRQREFAAVFPVQRYGEVRALHPDFIADRRIVRRRFRGFGRKRFRRGGLTYRFFHRVRLVYLPHHHAQHYQRRCPRRHHANAAVRALFVVLRLRFFARLHRLHFVRFQRNFAHPHADGFRRANVHARCAVDALMVAHMPNIHLAVRHAAPAVRAFALFDLHAENRHTREQPVNRPQRAEEAAERAVEEHARQQNRHHDDEFARKEDVEDGELARIDRVRQQAHCALERPRRADVLAESRHGILLQAVRQRDDDHKHRQQDVFEIRQRMGEAAFLHLRRRNLVEQFLNQPQRTEPAADGAPQNQPVEHQNAQNVVRRALIRGGQRVLQRPQRTCANRARTGVAVEPRHAKVLDAAGVDVALDESLHIGVVEQGGVNLYEPPGGGLMGAPPCRKFLSQGRYTPYKY